MSLRAMRVRPQKSALFVSPEKDENDKAAANASFKTPSSALKEARQQRIHVVYSTPSSAKKEQSPKLFSPPSALKEARLHSKRAVESLANFEPECSVVMIATVLIMCLASVAIVGGGFLLNTVSPQAPACHWDWLRGCVGSNDATSACRFVIGWLDGHIDLDICRGF